MSKKILLVEDEAIIAMTTAKMLEKHDFEVVTVYNGEKAVETVDNDPEISLILMDIDLGKGMDGTEAAEEILKKKDIPVVFLSSHTEPEVVEKTEKITSYGYVVKNSGETVLLASIKMAFKLYEAYIRYNKRNQELYALAEELEESNEELTCIEEDLRKRETSLTESDNRFRSVLQLVPDMISIHDPDMNILYSNWRSFAEVPESKRRIHTKCYKTYRNLDTICPDCLAKTVLKTGKPLRKEEELPEGMWVDIRAIPVLDKNNNVTMFVEWVRDITEEKVNRNKLKQSEEEYRRLFETMSPGVIYQSADGTIISANPSAEKMLGLTVNQMNRKTSMDPRWKMVDEEGNDVPGPEHPAMTALKTGKKVGPVDRAVFVPEKNKYVWLSITAIPLFQQGDKNPYQVYSTFDDITKRKRVEEALNASRDLLNNTQRIAKVGGWEWDVARQTMTWADQTYLVHGFEPGEFVAGSPEHIQRSLACYDPDDRPKIDEAFRKCVEEGKAYTLEVPLTTSQGRQIWVQTSARAVWEGGKVVKVQGHIMDITELKQAEEKLREALKEKEFLMRELNHRVKNNLAMVSSLISLKDSETENDLSDLKHRIDVIKLVHEKLHQHNDVEHIEVKEYFQELLESIFYSTSRWAVQITNTIEDVRIPTKNAIPLGLVVNEIATNAIKYGFKEYEEARFSVDMRKDSDSKHYTLTLSNTGNPFPEEIGLENPETMGLQLVSTLVAQLSGTIDLQKKPHPVFTIRFPTGEE